MQVTDNWLNNSKTPTADGLITEKNRFTVKVMKDYKGEHPFQDDVQNNYGVISKSNTHTDVRYSSHYNPRVE